MGIRAILRPAVAILAAGLTVAAPAGTLDGLVRKVRAAVERQQSDGDLAQVLGRFELDEKIDNRTAEELESLAPGPKSIAELETLREKSRSWPVPKVLPQFPSPPAPSPGELRDAIEAARRYALGYEAGLPDFICTRTVSRYERRAGAWWRYGAVTGDLTYFEHKERYSPKKISAVISLQTRKPLGAAAWSEGEFGGMLQEVFLAESQTAFEWSHWTTLRKRPTYVVSFRIEAGNSRYYLAAGKPGGGTDSIAAGEHGLVYIDGETKEVMRLDSEADSLPDDFPVVGASRTLDFGTVEVGGRNFLLPVRADARMTPLADRPAARNQSEFTSYRKFTEESTIKFGLPVDGTAAKAKK